MSEDPEMLGTPNKLCCFLQWGLLLYTALAPEALATTLQGRGQAKLPSAQGEAALNQVIES